ncbi:membrane bound transcription factor site 1 [Echinococcus multilocularis]|uniref:Membrane bound transcription factor site 1 n=1 Tax=Echinococcus multilocularis TaxID=6211 RepID=A0A068YFX6_ECHMU|nr:membrane bound transcription factor site 1 [Echinococcus multilocularis]
MYIGCFSTILFLLFDFSCIYGKGVNQCRCLTHVSDFIVLFKAYHSEEFRQSAIVSILDDFVPYFSFVYRNYSFMEHLFLSDFEIIETRNLNRTGIVDLILYLRSSSLIKNVFPDKPVHLHLANINLGKPYKRPEKKVQAPGTVNLERNNQPWRRLSTWDVAWSSGVCGQGVRVGIFDTGLVNTNLHSHFRNANVRERSNWTWRLNRDSRSDTNPGALDGHGHGTFVTGLIASAPYFSAFPSTLTCPTAGLAPRSELHIFRVFTDTQLSMTSWFLDAFNYAIVKRLHVINLSNGGPDFMDQPFVDKVNELSANGILLVSAIGNDGPVYGSLSNPADLMDVLGVGGVDANGDIATFSSRGATAMEMQDGYGRFKPDVVGWATGIVSSNSDGGCKTLSGTSAVSPVVTGSIALLISAVLSERPLDQPPINPASLKQAIAAGADPLVDSEGKKKFSIFEQGAGLLNLRNSIDIMRRLKPQASLWPSYLDFTECPYFWPYCSQPLYASGIPVVVNVTIVNSMGVHGRIVDRPVFHPHLNGDGGGVLLDIGVTFSRDLWPWTGYLALHISVRDTPRAATFRGLAEGWISLKVESDDPKTQTTLSTELKLALRVPIIPTPKREMRILWDTFHNIRYPAAYVPADDLTMTLASLDWLGDHIHTNFRDLYLSLRGAGYFVEVLQQPFTCFDASKYGTLMIVDPEEEFWPEEVSKLQADVYQRGLSLLVFAGWFNTSVQAALKFYDLNNRRLWVPVTGGTNVPALNALLAPFGVQFGDQIFGEGFKVGDLIVDYPSGSHLASMSTTQGHSRVMSRRLVDLGRQIIDRAAGLTESESRSFDNKQKILFSGLRSSPTNTDPLVPVLGLWENDPEALNSGRVGVFGDSSCLDSSSSAKNNCFWLVQSLLEFGTSGRVAEPLASALESASKAFGSEPVELPKPMEGSEFVRFSRVLLRGGEGWQPLVYRPILPCRAAPPGALVAPVALEKEMVYGPQPLLLNPPLRAKEARGVEADDSSIFNCHQRPPEGPDFESIDRYLAGAPSSRSVTLIREYFGFFLIAGSVILLLLNLRTLLELCTLRNLMRGMHALLRGLRGRRVHIQQRSGLEGGGRDGADDIGTFEIPRPPKAVVVETIHASLTYRFVRQCLRQQRC